MTAKELRIKFGQEFGFKDWPKSYEVDPDTYGHVCHAVLQYELGMQFPDIREDFRLRIAIGPTGGIMYKGVELILKGREI